MGEYKGSGPVHLAGNGVVMATAMNELEKITLHLENGSRLMFHGRLFSEAVWYDEYSGVLTHQKLYVRCMPFRKAVERKAPVVRIAFPYTGSAA